MYLVDNNNDSVAPTCVAVLQGDPSTGVGSACSVRCLVLGAMCKSTIRYRTQRGEGSVYSFVAHDSSSQNRPEVYFIESCRFYRQLHLA